MASLPELQRSFATALRDASTACAVEPSRNLQIYRNNSAHVFRSALEQSFPVLRKRVGDDYLRQLAHHYRERNPSHSGDLFWVGREFAAFLEQHLHGGDYAWLADLARLEWCCQEALVSVTRPAEAPACLAAFRPEELEQLAFSLQPSLRLFHSPYPVFSVWLANQGDSETPVDQSKGEERGLVHLHDERLKVCPVEIHLYEFVSHLAAGANLGDSITAARLEADQLTAALGFLFTAGLVTGVGGSR